MINGAVGGVSRWTRGIPRIASGLAVEAAWISAHLIMYPLGVLTEPAPKVRPGRPFPGLNPQQRAIVHEGLEIASTPILLVHGVGDDHSIFAVLDRTLRRRGFRNLSLPSRSARRYASSVRIRGSLLARNLDLAPPSNRNDTALT